MLAGLFAFLSLPVAQYPDTAPTTVRVSAGYPGATAQAVENSVTRVIDQAGNGSDALKTAAEQLVATARQNPGVSNINARGTDEDSALRIDIDKAESFGVSLSAVNSILSVIFAGSEVNDFVLGSSLRPVIVQAAPEHRMQPEDIVKWNAINADDEVVHFASFMTTSWEPVAPTLQRYGGTSALEISGSAGEGVSSGAAMDAMEEMVADLDGGYGSAWTGISYQGRRSGDQAPWLYAVSALVIFLGLAALYESWPIPFPVMLAVPVGVLGALAAAWLFGQSNDVYFKVGMLTTIGLAARNAILIVQSAEDLRRQGLGIAEAAVEAARLRLRPILMTALTFILGVLPLATATGAGAAAQNAIGTGVIGGMVASTYLWHLHGAGPLRPHHENGPLDPNESIEQMKPTRLVLVPMVLALSACAVGPDFRSPSQPVAANFAEGSAQPIGEASAQYWWRSYNDAMLNELVQTGLSQNLDIKTAISRVAEAQAAARATGLPAMISGSVSGDSIRAGGEAISGTTTTSGASFNPSLVLDLFGGERRSREAALASLQSAELSVGAARLTFLSQLVSSYIDLRYYQNALTITRQTLGTRRETLSLVQSQREAGAATALDEAQAQAALDESLASLPSLESGFYASSYAIATLLAQPVQTIETRLQRGAAQPRPGGNASAGVPADLLRNRPDVRAAERDYAAAVANVGVSEAQMYPSVSLGGTVSTSEGVGSWSFGPKVSLPVLNQGVLAAKRDQAIAQAEQAELGWRSSVLGAVEEVQASQSDYIRNQRAVAAYQRSVNSYERVVSLSRETYNGGTTTLLDFLDVQRSLASSRLTLASSVRDLAASWATLQVAAGKGWAFTTAPAPAGNGS